MPTLLIVDDREELMDSFATALDSGAECFMLISCRADAIAGQLKGLPADPKTQTLRLLHTLKVPAHRDGYRQLCHAIPLFAADMKQSLSKELYPAVAKTLGYSSGEAVEHSIRNVIHAAWEQADPEVWGQYFLAGKEAPSNKRFLSVLAEQIKQNGPPDQRSDEPAARTRTPY